MTCKSAINLLGLPRKNLAEFFIDQKEQSFRAQQLMRWVHHRGADNFSQMSDMSLALRERLDQHASLETPRIARRQTCTDGTLKFSLALQGGGEVESVFIPDRERGTLCVSSQVGCSLNCSFCATGKQGFQRNLRADEIIAQIWLAQKQLDGFSNGSGRIITNVVFMGMGEPLLNLDNVLPALSILNDDLGYGLSKKRVTVSTAGVIPGIERLAQSGDGAALAVSLHATEDSLRDDLVPINRKYPIKELLAACHNYAKDCCGKRGSITIEYALIKDVNDSPAQARQLAKLLRNLPCKINLIPFNPFPDCGDYQRPNSDRIAAFQNVLREKGYIVTVRATRGDQVAAACGQLTGSVRDRTRRSMRLLASTR